MACSLLRAVLAVSPALVLCACGPTREAGFNASLPPPPTMAPAVADGAIYHAATGYAPLYNGQRASQVGDLVTVVLIERTQTSKSASAKKVWSLFMLGHLLITALGDHPARVA